jgi:hypothetical protein
MPRLAHPHPDRTHRRPALVAVVVVLALGVLAGCGKSSDHSQPVEAGASPGTSAVTVAPSTVTSAPGTPAAVSVGPASVVVESIGATPTADGSWRSSGLVRNDATAAAGLHVRATLSGAAGQSLGVVDADSPVAPVRSGESVPFVVGAAGVASTDVASVSWQAFATGGSSALTGRDLSVSTYWTRPYGDAHRLDLPSYRDPSAGAAPFALYASLTDGGGGAVTTPTLVLAWVGSDGRVAAVASGRAVDSTGAPVASIAAGASDDVLVLVDDATIASGLEGLTPRTWSVGQ